MKNPGRDKKAAAGKLTLLGSGATAYPTDPAEAHLESFANPRPGREYWIEFDCPEFTSICPITGQPDFGHLVVRYIPARLCVESKSLKLYLYAFRNHGAFHEAVVNRVLDDLVAAIAPRHMIVRGVFRPRGGIAISVEAVHRARARAPRRGGDGHGA